MSSGQFDYSSLRDGPYLIRAAAPDFPSTEHVYLEENYRSTAGILDVAHAIVSQGEDSAI